MRIGTYRGDELFRRILPWVLMAGFLVRLYHLTDPFQEQYVWRSIDNAAIARNFVSQGMDIRYPRVDWAGPEGFVETELPLQMYAVALLYQLWGLEVPWLGRLLTVIAGMGLLCYFARLSRAWAGAHASLIATFMLAFVPTSVFYSRVFQQDALMLLAQVMALYHASRWLLRVDTPRAYDPFIVAVSLALSALIKPNALLVGAPLIVMAYTRFGRSMLWQGSLWAVLLLALFPPILWYAHARGIYLEHGYTFGIFSGGHDKFQWRRFLLQPYWYRVMLERMLTWHLTLPGLVLTLLGCLELVRRRVHHRGVLFTWAGTMVLSIPLVPEGNLDMLYYQWMCLPPLALVAGLGGASLIDSAPDGTASPKRSANPSASSWGKAGTLTLLVLCLAIPLQSAWVLRASFQVTQKSHLKLAAAILESVPEGALLLDAGAYDVHNEGGYNYEPLQFYYSRHKGWGLLESEFSIEQVEHYRHLGASYLVSKADALLEAHPDFVEALRKKYRFVRKEPGVFIVDLDPASTPYSP